MPLSPLRAGALVPGIDEPNLRAPEAVAEGDSRRRWTMLRRDARRHAGAAGYVGTGICAGLRFPARQGGRSACRAAIPAAEDGSL